MTHHLKWNESSQREVTYQVVYYGYGDYNDVTELTYNLSFNTRRYAPVFLQIGVFKRKSLTGWLVWVVKGTHCGFGDLNEYRFIYCYKSIVSDIYISC